MSVAIQDFAEPEVEAPPAPLDIRHLVVDLAPRHPSAANGVHNVARALIREQRAAGDAARLVVLARDARAVQAVGGAPTQAIEARGATLRGRLLRLRADVAETLLADAGDRTVLHIHGGREPLLLGLAAALRRRGVPYGITVHGRYSHAYDGAGRRLRLSTALYLEALERRLLEAARFVQALSAEEAKVLRRVAPRAAIAVVGNGAYSSRHEGAPPRPCLRRPPAADPRFVYCGRYEIGHKGLDLLLEGFALYRRRGGTGRLTTIGTGPARAELLAMAERLGLGAAVRIEGPLFGAERDAALRLCDAFVMASRFEGVPLAALEAAMLGLPLLVSAGTGLRDAVEAAGAGIGIGDGGAEAVAEAMRAAEALSPEAWRAKAAAAWRLTLAAADWTAIAARLRGLYAP